MAALSLNDRASALADDLAAEARALRVTVTAGPGGERLIDCGLDAPGGTEAGLRLARIATGGLASVALYPSGLPAAPLAVTLHTAHPVLACLGSQYAGWHIALPDAAPVLGSGPARLLARREPILDDIPHGEAATRAVLLLETEAAPGPALAAEVARACGLAPDRLTLLLAPTGSPAALAQIAARALECAVQKARAQGFPLDRLREGRATAPLAPPHPGTRVAMGRANDAIIYAGRAHLLVTGPEDEARDLARALPSCTSPHWGQSFAEVWEEAQGDFARIDAGLFSPAEILVTALDTGRSFASGEARPERLAAWAERLAPGSRSPS